ncbi:hydroxyacyl-coenzyme A dehydrogenase, mitochondrial-like [Artemia franciscana]|uniref:3-hydroxyacyl-CoA dehydrogenase n=1 Tax=Artemia franciscana TaxID=6661 RepID=A0AA88LBC2_ARTSF|nr:hypothetical protein QYM36_009960 [Artemia franciscana]
MAFGNITGILLEEIIAIKGKLRMNLSRLVVPSRSFSASAVRNAAINQVTVIGSGLMGAGIAQVAAQTGHKVNLVDLNDDVLKKAENSIKTSVSRVAKKQFKDDTEKGNKFIDETLTNITYMTDNNRSVATADLVIEAIIENVEIKRKLFSSLDKAAPSHTIFASNTSSLPIKDIAESTTRLDRFGGLHFFNPVPVMKLLEIIRIPETSDATYNKMVEWGKNMGKVTVTCKDTPGFIVNRLLVPYMMEALRMLERGDASARDIDTSMKLGAGYPMGPLELADYVGLDTSYYIVKGWAEKYPDNTLFENVPLLEKLIKEGKFGVKSGEGIYSYKK